MFKIGKIEIENRIILAPMAGVSNSPFRKLCQKYGAAFTYTEMTSNVGLKYDQAKAIKHAGITADEEIVALQIFGGDVDDYVTAAKYYDKNSFAKIIDINFGCPVNKVAIKSKAGSSLLLTPDKIYEIVSKITKNISKPLTVKIRIGWDENNLNYLEVAEIIERAGAAAIAVHGRTRSQMYKGSADWDAIKRIKEHISIPVIGNGDIKTPQQAKEMLEYTKVDGIMIARGARENPWIFDQINHYLKTDEIIPMPNLKVVCQEIRTFLENNKLVKGEKSGFLQTKGIVSYWLNRFNLDPKIKNSLLQSKTELEFLEVITKIELDNFN